MSNSWAGGSTRRWRRIRAQVLVRDGFLCQLRLPGCTRTADQVHHVVGKKYGDDPQLCVAACGHCNRVVGEPGRDSDRPNEGVTKW